MTDSPTISVPAAGERGVNQTWLFWGCFIALVATGTRRVTVRASTLNIAVRQEALTLRAKGLCHRSFINIVPIKQGEKDILRYLSMIGSAGTGK